MDFRDTPEEAAFRATLRSWLQDALPGGLDRPGAHRRPLAGVGEPEVEPHAATTRATSG